MGKEPERRHSSYYPTSSLARTPSHGAEYSKYRGNNKIAVDPLSHSQNNNNNNKNSEYLNPINILGIPATARRSNQDRPGSGVSTEGPASRSSSSTAGRMGGLGGPLDQQDRGNFRILKNSFGAAGRCGMGSLLNLNKIPHKTSLQRSNSARECGGGGDYSTQHTERIQVSNARLTKRDISHYKHTPATSHVTHSSSSRTSD